MRYKTDFKYIRPGPLFLGKIMVIKLLLLSTHHRQLFCQICTVEMNGRKIEKEYAL